MHSNVQLSRPPQKDLRVAQIETTPSRIMIGFKRVRFGDTEIVEIRDPVVLARFVGNEFSVTTITLGGDFRTTLADFINSANTETARVLVSELTRATGLPVEDLVSTLIDHNATAPIFVPRSCAVIKT